MIVHVDRKQFTGAGHHRQSLLVPSMMSHHSHSLNGWSRRSRWSLGSLIVMFGVGWVGTVGGEVVFDGGEGTVGCLASLGCCCCWSCGFWKLLKIRNIESINLNNKEQFEENFIDFIIQD